MKDFDVSTITTSGAQLLAQATEGNRLVVSGCEANTTIYTSETAKAVTAPTGTRISNEIELVGVQDNKIIVRARFTQSETTGGNANSLVLFGRLENDTEETRTAICVVSNNAQFYLPSSASEAVQDFECLFTIDYEIQSNVVVEQTSALECSLAEFRLLKERTVTSHKEGNPNVGDPTQNIFGEKVFQNQIGFVENANFTSLTTFNGGITVNDRSTFEHDVSFNNPVFFDSYILLNDSTSSSYDAGYVQIGGHFENAPRATVSRDKINFECVSDENSCDTSYKHNGISISGKNTSTFIVSDNEFSWKAAGSSLYKFKAASDRLSIFERKNGDFGVEIFGNENFSAIATDSVQCTHNIIAEFILLLGGAPGKELIIEPDKNEDGSITGGLLFSNFKKLQLKNTWTDEQSQTGTCDQSFGYSEQKFAITNKITAGENVVDGELAFSGSNLYGKYSVNNSASVPASLGDSSNPWDKIYCKESVIVKNGRTKNLSTCVENLSGSIGNLSLSKIDNTSSNIDVRDLVFESYGSGNPAGLPAGLTMLFIMSKSSSDIKLDAGDDLTDAVVNNSIAFSNTINGNNLGSVNLNGTITILLSSVYLKAGDTVRHPVLVWIKKMST